MTVFTRVGQTIAITELKAWKFLRAGRWLYFGDFLSSALTLQAFTR